MAKPLAFEAAQMVKLIIVNTIENFERFRHVNCVKCGEERVCFNRLMIFFLNFETLASGQALFSKIINNIFFFYALEHPVSDNSFCEIQTLVLRDRYSRPKKVETLSKLSVWDFRQVSTRSLFFNFLTDLRVPIMLSICFSMTKGERDVTAFSSIDLITRNRAKPLLLLNTK